MDNRNENNRMNKDSNHQKNAHHAGNRENEQRAGERTEHKAGGYQAGQESRSAGYKAKSEDDARSESSDEKNKW